MNFFMWSAAALMALTTGVHLFAGTGDIMTPIMQTNALDPVIRGVAMVVWHMVTLILALSTLAIAYLARRTNPALTLFIIASQIGFGLIFLTLNITMFGALFAMPQWTVFLATPALMIASWLRAV